MSNPFGGFRDSGSYGSHHRRMMPSQFGVRDSFDDPFFTHPFDSMFGRSDSYSSTPQIIEGDEEDNGFGYDEKYNSELYSRKDPSVEHPYDDVDANGTKQQAHFQTCKVTYGGVDGEYYTSTRTRKAGSDGVVFEESKEADRTTGQATHRISRGIHDKGHSVTRKLYSDGKVDRRQTLHNLNEDELNGFEEAWKGNQKLHMLGWRDESVKHNNALETSAFNGNIGPCGHEPKGKATWGSRWLPSAEHARNYGGTMSDYHKARTTASKGRTKNGVRINIE